MPKKAIALALSVTAIIFCVSNIDKRASAELDEALNNAAETAEIHFETQEQTTAAPETKLKTLAEEKPASAPANSVNANGLNFSLKRLLVHTSDYNALQNLGAKVNHLYKDFYVLEFDSEEATRSAFLTLSDLESIQSVDPDIPVKLSAVSPSQYAWGVENVGANYYKDWLDVTDNNNTVKIAVVDSGINNNHLAFKNESGVNDRIVITANTKDYVNNDADPDDENGHGTSVAGTIVESTPANVKIYPSKVFGASGKIEGQQGILNVFYAIANAVNEDKVDIVNLSLGFDAQDESDIVQCSENQSMSEFFDSIRSAGVLVIAAAGNEAHSVGFPANCSSVVAVSSVKQDRTFSSDFSNYGPEIDFAMPGESLLLPTIIKSGETAPSGVTNDNAMRTISGTSFSSPFLAAAAALIKLENPSYTPAQIIAALKSYAVSLGDSNYYGNGIVDFGAKKFNTPHIQAKTQATNWVKMDAASIDVVSSQSINGYAVTTGTAEPSSSSWQTASLLATDNSVLKATVAVPKNGTYSLWLKTTAGTKGKATITESYVDSTGPSLGSQITFSNAGTDTITINVSAQDSQSGLKKVTLYYRKKGTSSYNSETLSYSNVTAQTNLNFVLTGLEDTTEYEFYIEAEDALGNTNASPLSAFTTQTTDPISLPDAGGQGTTDPQQPVTNPDPVAVNTATNPVTVDPVIIYFAGFVGSTMLGFAIYRTIGGRR
jgi:subtilisin family serine protease